MMGSGCCACENRATKPVPRLVRAASQSLAANGSAVQAKTEAKKSGENWGSDSNFLSFAQAARFWPKIP